MPADAPAPSPASRPVLLQSAWSAFSAGQLDRARELCDAVLRSAAKHPDALLLRGLIHQKAGEPQHAERFIERAIAAQPGAPFAHYALGLLRLESNQPASAAIAFGRAVALDPNFAPAWATLAAALRGAARPRDALEASERALALMPDAPAAHCIKADLLGDLDRHEEAIGHYQRVLALRPDHYEALNSLGNGLQLLGRHAEAIGQYERALALRPDDPLTLNNLGNARLALGEVTAALACFDRGLAQRPADGKLLAGRGRAFHQQGRFDAARASFEAALATHPERAEIHSSLLYLSNHDPTVSEAALLEMHREFGRRLAAAIPAAAPHANRRDPERVLRIGYVSGDFASHPVGYLSTAALAAHDRRAIAVYAYSGRIVEDAMTARIRAAVDVWRPTAGIGDAALADQIRDDAIDILVDLSGHTHGHRLAVFARKPAPVQASWIGYFNTTGLEAIDYLLTDAAHVPPGSERWFTEQIVRLPVGRFCYAPPELAPDVAPPPMVARGHVTFGSFNNLSKVTPPVIELWARVVGAVPDARLVLKWRSLADAGERERLLAAFDAAGLVPARVELRPAGPHAAMLAEYGDLDIALDPFPFCGGLTSCEALWMGVPVVTLPGTRPVSRQTLGLLAQLGLDELAARDPADYVAIAAGLARDSVRLSALRATLRSRMTASPLCDAARFTRGLEAAYRELWRRWCAS